MKTQLITNSVEQWPKLMRNKFPDHEHFIVLFLSRRSGTVLTKNPTWRIGYYSDSWDKDTFEELPKGHQLILEND